MQSPLYHVTLEPLRSLGPDVLDAHEVPQIHHIELREIQFARDNAFHETITRHADDLFRCAEREAETESLFPADAVPTHASFDVHFTGTTTPRSVLLRAPATINFERESDGPFIKSWLAARGLIRPNDQKEIRPE